MDLLRRSCDASSSYPVNLLYPKAFPYEHELYRQRLCAPATQKALCFEQKQDGISQWGIHVWEKHEPLDEYALKVASTVAELRHCFEHDGDNYKRDAASRFMFIHARNACDRLNLTLPMLQQVLSHYQVAPSIVDQLLSYGRRKNEQDFSSRLFYSNINNSPAYKIPELARSGHNFNLGYTLRTIEDPHSWTMRQLSVYHSFDMSTGRAFWLIIKASPNIRERLQEVTRASTSVNDCASNDQQKLFAATLSSHLVMCKWSNENWRPYLQELESDVHSLTKPAVVYEPKPPTNMPFYYDSDTLNSVANRIPRPVRKNSIQRASTFITRPFSRSSTSQTAHQPPANRQPTLDEQIMEDLTCEVHEEDADQFSILEMQRIQAIEEKLNSALLVLKGNQKALSQLRDFYQTISEHKFDSQTYRQDAEQFSDQITNVLSDLEMQAWRLETLQKLLSDRKILFSAIIEHRTAEANKDLAKRAQKSQENMEKMTNQMSDIAEKTQQETVSMRIITLVTLFFLPGTFISTLMSTSIIQFDSNDSGDFQRLYSSEALALFFEISVPLMAATFIAWYAIYLWVKHRQKIQKIQKMKFMHIWQQTGQHSQQPQGTTSVTAKHSTRNDIP